MRRQAHLQPRLAALIVALATLAAPPSAHAQDAEALLRQGVEARRRGEDEAALELFRRADEAQPSGVARAQMGLAEQALGRWAEAYADLTAALATRDDFVRRNRPTLEGALSTVRGHVGLLELRGGEAGAQVEINGRPVGAMPLPDPVPVAVGEAIVVVRMDGYHRFSRTVQIGAGRSQREDVRLVAREADEPVAPAEPAAPPGQASTASAGPPSADAAVPGPGAAPAVRGPVPVGYEPAPAPRPAGGRDGGLLALGITFTALTVVSAGLATGFGVGFAVADDFYGSPDCDGPDRARVCPQTLEARGINEGGAIVSSVGAGVSLVLAIVFYGAYAGSSSKVDVACGGGPGDIGVGCGARF